MNIRPLQEKDIDEWIKLIQQLSPKANLGTKTARSTLVDLTLLSHKSIFVVENDGKIIGTVSVLYEDKVNRGTVPNLHRFYCVAHIEEFVVDINYRGQNIGLQLMKFCVEEARKNDAYKIILDCSESNIGFYEKCGFIRHEVCMRMDI